MAEPITYRTARFEEIERRVQWVAAGFAIVVAALLLYVTQLFQDWLAVDTFWSQVLDFVLRILALLGGCASFVLLENFICRPVASCESAPEPRRGLPISYMPYEFAEGTVFVDVGGVPVSEAQFRELVQEMSRQYRHRVDYRTTQWMG